jgi:hypothetical protein
MVSRREFLRRIGATTAVTLASQTTFPANANPLGMPIGFQDIRI